MLAAGHMSNTAYTLKSATESRAMISQVWGALSFAERAQRHRMRETDDDLHVLGSALGFDDRERFE